MTVTAPKAMKAVVDAMFVADAVSSVRMAYQGWKFARMGAKALAKAGARAGVSNPVPDRMARVIPGEGPYSRLGPPGRSDVFVTAADDIAGMNARQISHRLTINPSKKFTVIEFNTPKSGVASPINRYDPGFVGGGRTAGGAREFVIPNQVVPTGSTVRIAK